ncbi:hypothetical protein A3709_14355 [Halioglobus sp. HI00S01]|uniref:lysoplasmalogenase n=1 Tax=Halioglobus sp. HI00S01 TaxID=1822214 RepID=UPI0007C21681|nr:lysoplasmalogenase [Halioglobus sp. HI00S01]KZX59472.1 hypothetical protein A3709_14355 [Halioglobus sp. HI00S01]
MPEFFWELAKLPLLTGGAATIALVAADFGGWRPGRYLLKPLAAACFIWLALSLGATASNYGLVMLAGLILCMLGDIALMFESEGAFLTGLVAFLCGHLAYVAAFLQLPINTYGVLLSLSPTIILVAITLRWLCPHLEGPMRHAVPAYIGVIAVMLVAAGGTLGLAGAGLIILGAWGFALSDLAVARRQFISSSRINQLWGTPLYFAAQYLLAASVCFYSAG